LRQPRFIYLKIVRLFKNFIFFFGLVFINGPVLAGSEDTINFRPHSYSDRQYQYDNFMLHYAGMASAMSIWQGDRYSYMNLGGDVFNGDFITPQMFENGSSIDFNTESFFRNDSLESVFYGEFGFNSRKDNNASWNLFYSPAENGSQFGILTPAEGKWESQEYRIKGSVSRRIINEKIFFGLCFNYKGDINNRINDVRNNQINLFIDLAPSLTYSINEMNSISLGLAYSRSKMEPKTSTFISRSQQPNYRQYFFSGLGPMDKEFYLGTGIYRITSKYEFNSQWIYSDQNNVFSVKYSLLTGNELWEEKINIPFTNDFPQPYKYDWIENKGKLAITNQSQLFKSISSFSFSLKDGMGYTFNEKNDIFQKAFTYYNLLLNLESGIYLQMRYLEFVKPAIVFNNVSILDLTNGQKEEYSTLKATIDLSLLKTRLFKGDLMFLGGAGLNKNLNYIHDPLGADDIDYTINVIYPSMSYLTSDFIVFSPGINWEKTIKKVLLSFEAGGHFINPTRINYQNQYTNISESSYYRNAYLDIKLVF
jgi:hypothetical protein